MAKFTQHIPTFIDHEDSDLLRFKFHSFNGLRRNLKKLLPNSVSDSEELCRGDSDTVMTVTKPSCEGYAYYVIGLVEGFDLSKTPLKSYDDPYYRDCKIPQTSNEEVNDVKIEDVVNLGRKLVGEYKVKPPQNEAVHLILNERDGFTHTKPVHSNMLWCSFCCEFQHFYYVGNSGDLFYYVGLIEKGRIELKDKIAPHFFHINFDDIFEYIKNTPLCNFKHYEDIAIKCFEKYIKNSFSDYEIERDNFGYWFEKSIIVKLYLEDLLGVHKELPKELTK